MKSAMTAFINMQAGGLDIKRGTAIQSQEVSFVDSHFLSVFDFPLISGAPDALKDPALSPGW